ncbi:hypothetical protein SRHO_G00238420 [Serrasalmus rhombeus]
MEKFALGVVNLFVGGKFYNASYSVSFITGCKVQGKRSGYSEKTVEPGFDATQSWPITRQLTGRWAGLHGSGVEAEEVHGGVARCIFSNSSSDNFRIPLAQTTEVFSCLANYSSCVNEERTMEEDCGYVDNLFIRAGDSVIWIKRQYACRIRC